MSVDHPCPVCDAYVGVSYHFKVEKFKYGVDGTPDQVELEATVLEGHCDHCNFNWTGYEAERARDQAVYKHLQKENTRLKKELFELRQVVEAFKEANKA